VREEWTNKSLGEVCTLMTGGTPSREKPEYFDGGSIKWLVSGDIHQKEIKDCTGRITQLGLEKSNAKYLPKNAVIIALNGQGKTRATVALLRTEATCNQSMVSIYPKDPAQLLPEYIYANLHGRYKEIRQITGDSGNERRGLNMNLVRNIRIPIAPVHEQKRIVAILDEALTAIATAAANAEKNLVNARELFEIYLDNIFNETRDDWKEDKLGDVCEFQGGSQPPKSVFSAEKKDGYVRLIQIRDYKSDKHVVHIPESLARRYCSPDDVMIARYGPPLFQILRGIAGAYNVALMKAMPNEDFITKDYLYYFLKNRDMLRYIIRSSSRAAGQAGVNKATLDPYLITYPNKTTQVQIVLQIEDLHRKAQILETISLGKITLLAELKQSILHKAFTGELTADPKLIDRTLAGAGV